MPARICLVTIHGIGFEQPPIYTPGEVNPSIEGYADDLHENLSLFLDGNLLSDDPERKRHLRGQNGVIYVQSVWPGNSYNVEAGRSRLGTWNVAREINVLPVNLENQPAILFNQQGQISHVALVYSQEEGQGSLVGTSLQTSLMALTSLKEYGRSTNVAHMLFTDLTALWKHAADHRPYEEDEPSPSLRIRQDAGFYRKDSQGVNVDPHDNQATNSLLTTLRQVENDVAAYVCSNNLRERIRSFVLDALQRLACRDDVDGIVINAHSNGTVVAFDVVRNLPPFAARKIWGLVTAGSPLRKYAKLFSWGSTIATIPPITTWLNFFDPKDIVADPLCTPANWLIEDPDPIHELRYEQINLSTGKIYEDPDPESVFLYQALNPNTGQLQNIPIHDRPVDNLTNSVGGGMKAHNYWDNSLEFVKPLSDLLKQLVANPPVTTDMDT
ncbi:hypothetical protein [Tengunoibacter tsumagoiensis]|uniref:Uncharacterized protein n=1 Tax=Tengunoibacter tsumagoiensis TaxID=2014871 RepID=A0A401ZZT0_9CHLR|nr:hypothetical protein [Tengunoibacter tsumagoiensis]GCE12339.1 hypothetical protein KTT_21980 [Tengunoibacter tsumagoiensis]